MELAVVLVLIGLLLGTLLLGNGILMQSRIKFVANEFEHLKVAVLIYQDRYGALPGDDARASSRWVGRAKDGTGDGRNDPLARVPELSHHTCRRHEGLVPRTLTPLLNKRTQYKRLLTTTANPLARAVLDQRQTALKWLLVVSFGYLGYKNARFGRIEAHESVTAYSEILLQAKETAEQEGYRLLHAIVDSLWLQKPGAAREDYDRLARMITERTGLPINVEGLYRWIGFLPSRVNPRMPVPNQFVGLEPFEYQPGQPFRIMPIGSLKRGERTLDITAQRLRDMANNYESNRPRWRIPIYA